MTDDMNAEPWACRVAGRAVEVAKRQHYRLVMGTVGHSLKSVRGAQELLHAAYDVFTGTYFSSHVYPLSENFCSHERCLRKG